jgi:hypothetical protein
MTKLSCKIRVSPYQKTVHLVKIYKIKYLFTLPVCKIINVLGRVIFLLLQCVTEERSISLTIYTPTLVHLLSLTDRFIC